MNDSGYRDSYSDDGFYLPAFLGSHYERGAGDFIVLDSQTGELLTRKHTVLWADAKKGYFVAETKTSQGIRYVAHYNPNIQIIKTEEFYEEVED